MGRGGFKIPGMTSCGCSGGCGCGPGNGPAFAIPGFARHGQGVQRWRVVHPPGCGNALARHAEGRQSSVGTPGGNFALPGYTPAGGGGIGAQFQAGHPIVLPASPESSPAQTGTPPGFPTRAFRAYLDSTAGWGTQEPALAGLHRNPARGLTAVANKGSGEVSSSAAANESPIDAECAPPLQVSVRVPGRNDIRDVLRRLGVGPLALAAVPAIAFNASNGVSLFGGRSGAEANALAACKRELEDYARSLRVQHRHPDCGECYARSGVSRVRVRCEPRLKLVGDGGCFIAYRAGGVPAIAVAVSPASEVEFLIECACPFIGGNVH
jgi:hypothetical protein